MVGAMRTSAILAAAVAVAVMASARPAHAQFMPEAGPGREQQEFATTFLLGPEAVVLGGFIGGGAVYAIEKRYTTQRGATPAVVPVAIGAGVGIAVAATVAQWTISNKFHPGSRIGAATGAALGAAAGTAIYFGGPGNEKSSDALYRLLGGIFLAPVAAYADWHVDSELLDFGSAAPAPAWADHVGGAGAQTERAPPVMATRVTIHF
jgi:hypothetical protein